MSGPKLAPKWKRHVQTVALITLVYVLFGLLVSLYNYSLLSDYVNPENFGRYNPTLDILINVIIGLIAGIIGGSGAIWLNQELFRKRSYGYSLLTTFILFTLLFTIITLIVAITSISFREPTEANPGTIWNRLVDFIFDPVTATFFIIWSNIVVFTIFLLQVNDKFGPGVLKKFLLGKYHRPREEERIFMFLDMRSSTTIAEKLGNTVYFNLLYEVFSDLTPAIVRFRGEIYQYVGDEIVVSWEIPKGVKQSNCIRCFYAIQDTLQTRAGRYTHKFGVAPEFKAGIHHGRVTAGEIGQIKRDIVYSGDVLNTTARIQEQCNKLGVSFLISGATLALVNPSEAFQAQAMGQINLRGKQDRVDLYTINILRH
ncbi:MAG: adenylate/guanylate cyclase domain-containing protein [Bacteroidota bacterium]